MASVIGYKDQNLDNDQEQPCVSRLLVVDDDESVAITVGEVLRRKGFSVDTAMNGQEALSLLSKTQYDLVLTDLHMEGMDGISLLSEIHRSAPLTILIVLTGFASLESAIAAMRRGAYDYLIKPCNIEDMTHTIQRGLDHRRLMLVEQEARARLEQMNHELEQRVEERTAELQRVNQELAEADHAKNVFLATLSHELRTPLSPILGWARLLRSGKIDQAMTTRAIDAIERNALLQARLIDDLLDVSRIVSGKLTVEREPADLCAIVRAAVDAVRDKAASRDIYLDIDIPDSTIIVQGSPVRLQQIIWNFLSNAIKFTERGGRVSARSYSRRGEARVEVSDTGVGIAPEFLPHIFEPFSQGDTSLTRQTGGLGLGLAIARKLAELQGGRVSAESEGQGKGSRFTLTLPMTSVTNAEHESEEATSLSRIPRLVLLVDDSSDTLEMLETMFKQVGCQVMIAESADAALRAAKVAVPDLIISDIGMPETDGYELLARLRHLPGIERVPAIAVSGYASEEDAARAFTAGFSAHLAKPVDFDKLFALIQNLLSSDYIDSIQ